MTNQSVWSLFEIDHPGSFLALYRFMIRKTKTSTKKTLVSQTHRLLVTYEKQTKYLNELITESRKGLLSRLKMRRKIKRAKEGLIETERNLFAWVEKTLFFFCPSVK